MGTRRFFGSCGSATASTSLFFFNNLVQNKSKVASLLSLDRVLHTSSASCCPWAADMEESCKARLKLSVCFKTNAPKVHPNYNGKVVIILELLGFVPFISVSLHISSDQSHSSMSSVWLFKTTLCVQSTLLGRHRGLPSNLFVFPP